MRLLGFDVDYEDKRDDRELARISQETNRILLTRDRQLLMRKNVSRGLIIRNTDPDKQIVETIHRLDLWPLCKPFTRCIECNGEIRNVSLDEHEFKRIKNRIPDGVLSWCKEFHLCSSCDKIYWKGSHYERLRAIIDRIIVSVE